MQNEQNEKNEQNKNKTQNKKCLSITTILMLIWIIILFIGILLSVIFRTPIQTLGFYHAIVLSYSFVASLYLWQFLGFPTLPRDNRIAIKQRMISVFFVCIFGTLYVFFVVPTTTLELWMLGIRIEYLFQSIGVAVGLSMCLFLGSLVQIFLDFRYQESLSSLIPQSQNDKICLFRNLIYAPLAEEYVFRSLCSAVMIANNISPWIVIVSTSILFGMAHSHHILEHGRLISIIIMFTYTSIFGFYSAVIFFCTGHLFAVILAHGFCNLMGLPDFDALFTHQYRIVLWICYIIGVIAFSLFLAFGALDPIHYDSLLFLNSSL
eukprot:c36775_g1_i1.p1 GENE.c36775_g1_i1~~c36775_g1_i1.p1  ORF type:complete len:341 (-),score=77.34 c36775_g1_i1:8-970(-)